MATGRNRHKRKQARHHYTSAFIRGKKPPLKGVFKYKDEGGEWRQNVRTLKAQGISEAKRELAELRVSSRRSTSIRSSSSGRP